MSDFCVKVDLLYLAKQYRCLFLGTWIFLGCSVEEVPLEISPEMSLENGSSIPVLTKNEDIILLKTSVETEAQISEAQQEKEISLKIEVEEKEQEKEQEDEGLKKQEAFYLFGPECKKKSKPDYYKRNYYRLLWDGKVSYELYNKDKIAPFFNYTVHIMPHTYSRLINPVVLSTIKGCKEFDCGNAQYHHQYLMNCPLRNKKRKPATSYEMIATTTLHHLENAFNYYKNKKLGYNVGDKDEERYTPILVDYIGFLSSLPPGGRWKYRNSIKSNSPKAPNLYIVSPSHLSDTDPAYMKLSRRFFENTFDDKKKFIHKGEPSFVIYASKSKKTLPKAYLWESRWVVAHRFAQYMLATHSRFSLPSHSPDLVRDQLKRQKNIHYHPLSKHPSQPIYTSSDFYLYPLSFFFFPGEAKKNDRKLKQPLTLSAMRAWQVFVSAFANQWAHYAISGGVDYKKHNERIHEIHTKGLACLDSDYNLRSDVMADGTEKLLTQKRLEMFQSNYLYSLMPSSHMACDQFTDFTDYDIVGATLAYWVDRITLEDSLGFKYRRINQMLILLAQHIGDRIERGNLSFTIEELFAEYIRHIAIWVPLVYDHSPSKDSSKEKKRKFKEKTKANWNITLSKRQCDELQNMPLSMREHWKSKGYFNCDWDPKPVIIVSKPKILETLKKQKSKKKKAKTKDKNKTKKAKKKK
ncbi:MAG: hypothetical protein OXC44_00965 [Proteobacteria bacterium]|nr:hypothetical protein [Pseudomonadota bacterium]